MTRALKVYGWLGGYPPGFDKPDGMRHRVQARCVIAATSKAEAARITGQDARGRSSFLSRLTETGNTTEIAVATSRPGVVFFQDDLHFTPGEKVYVEHPTQGRSY